MPGILERLGFKGANPHRGGAEQPRQINGFTGDGRVVLTDQRGTKRAQFPTSEKGATLSNDPLAIYKPTGAKHVDAAKAMGTFSNWTYAAVNAIASEISNIEFRMYQIKGDVHEELEEHPLLTLLDTVNETMTGIELKYVIASHLELTGNAYLLLEGVSNENDEPKAIYPLNPGRIRVHLNKDSFPYKLSHYEMTLDGKVYTFQPYQICHIKYPDPNDPYVGIGVPQAIPTWIDSDNYAMEYNRKFFINGAALGVYIAAQTNVEGQLDRIRKGFDNEYSGVDKAHRTPIMPKGTELKNAGASNRDMDFAKLAETTRDRILAGYRVSKTILGTAESDTNRATAETADYVFSKRTIKPKMQLIVSYFNEFIIPRYGDDVYLTFIDPTPEDKQFRTKEMQASVANQPVLTQNEARRTYLGMGPVEGGDQLMTLGTLDAVGTTDAPEGEDVAPNLAKTAEGLTPVRMRTRKHGKTVFSASHKMRSILVEAFEEALEKENPYEVKSVTDLTHSEYMEHWKRFNARTDKTIEELETVFKALNEKQKEEVLRNLPEATGAKAIGQLFDAKQWIALTVDLTSAPLTALAKDEAAAAFQMIGADAQDIFVRSQVREELDKSIQKMAKSYNQTTLDQLKEEIGKQMADPQGWTLADLEKAVNDVYDFADTRRAGLIAKTESFRASNWANKQAWKATGQVKTVQWYTAEDSHVCGFCAQMEEQGPVPIDNNFLDSGASVSADGKDFTANYGDISAPPLHPDCRCYMRPSEITL